MPNRPATLARLAAVLCVSLPLGACALFGGGDGPLPDIMPSDFRFVHEVREATQPPIDYTLAFDRAGVVKYEVTHRAPRRDHYDGALEIGEETLQRLYAALLVAGFDTLPEVLEAGEGMERRDVGQRTYFVRADGWEKRVETRFTDTPELAMIRSEMLKDVPERVFTGRHRQQAEAPQRLIAEEVNRKFHREGCKVLEAAGGHGREFDTVYSALDFGYDPCEACDPLAGTRR